MKETLSLLEKMLGAWFGGPSFCGHRSLAKGVSHLSSACTRRQEAAESGRNPVGLGKGVCEPSRSFPELGLPSSLRAHLAPLTEC